MLSAAYVAGVEVGWPWDKGDPLNPSSFNPGKALSDAEHIAQPILDIGHTILSTAQGVLSLIPGIGTGISAAIGAGLAVLEGGGALEIAIKTAYGAIPIPPGVRQFTDAVVDGALSLMHQLMAGKDLASSAIASLVSGARKAILGKLPSIAQDIAAQVFDTLAHLLLQAIHGTPTLAVNTKPMSAVAKAVAQKAHAAGKAPPRHVVPIAPTATAHAGLHLGLSMKAQGAHPQALAPAATPAAHAMALSLAATARPAASLMFSARQGRGTASWEVHV